MIEENGFDLAQLDTEAADFDLIVQTTDEIELTVVPEGDVIAREDVFGMVRPAAATMGTTMSVVRFPGSPPTQCLSATTGAGQLRRSPTSIIARVSAIVS